jgi:alanine racemase
MKQKILHSTISTSGVVRPTQVEVDLERLAGNYRTIRDHVAPAKMMAVVKANAYGHGMVRAARLYQALGADYIGVAVLEEGILLRESGIKIPILVMGGILGNQVPHFLKNDLTLAASSIERLKQIDGAARSMGRKAKVHLKIDTGMERIGVHYYNAEPFLETALSCQNVDVEGIFSHFANSESADSTHSRLQLTRFLEVLEFYTKRGIPRPSLCHIANSGAILQIPEARFDMVRPGILLYGVYPSAGVRKTVPVRPALSWKSRVVYFKIIRPNHPVGYGSAWISDRPVHAVTVPVGYGDGYFRSMSGKAEVILRGKRYPVIGTISMDQIVVNLDSDSAYSDDEVVLIGEMDGESITCEDLAEWAGTIPYEILTNINTRVPRVYLNESREGR